jgi:REP element-mobilizing transposase RayT
MTSILNYHDGSVYALDAFVIMPNHVHALVCPQGDAELNAITKTWKTVSAHRVNRLLGRSGTLWQHESWDHIVRSPEHLDGYRRYIEANPGKAQQQQ